MSELANELLAEFKSETAASRKCLDRIPADLFGWKPHEKSMNMGYLAFLVADIPRWIIDIIEKTEIDFATYNQIKFKNTAEMVSHFDNVVKGAEHSLSKLNNEILSKTFHLKNNGQILYSSPVKENLVQTLNHWVHHRGQLTVYMRLNNIPVPSIYGPSADDRRFLNNLL